LAAHELVVDVCGELCELLLAETGKFFACVGAWCGLFDFGEVGAEEAEELYVVGATDALDLLCVWTYAAKPGGGGE
jgi:hypothetical protein